MNSHGMHLTNCFLNPCFVFHSKQNILSAVKVYEYTLYQIQKLDKAITKFLRNILPDCHLPSHSREHLSDQFTSLIKGRSRKKMKISIQGSEGVNIEINYGLTKNGLKCQPVSWQVLLCHGHLVSSCNCDSKGW